jgi:hypothetical protein
LKEEVFDRKEVVEVTYIYSISDSHVLHTYRIDRFRIVFGYNRERNEYISIPKDIEIRFSSSDCEAFLQPFMVAGSGEFSRYLADVLRRRLSKVYFLSAAIGSIPWTYPVPEEKTSWYSC